MRILAVDHGERRIGLALSDELGWTAAPLTVIERRSLAEDLARIVALVREHRVGKVVVGQPISLSGHEGPQARRAARFAARLAAALPAEVPVELYDERFTTFEAERRLAAAGRRADRGRLDAVAAAVLLQHYLDERR